MTFPLQQVLAQLETSMLHLPLSVLYVKSITLYYVILCLVPISGCKVYQRADAKEFSMHCHLSKRGILLQGRRIGWYYPRGKHLASLFL